MKFLLLLFLLIATPVFADEIAIIATVGDDVITTQDLVARTRLVILSASLPSDEQTAKKIAPQVLQNLINEKIYLQNAQKLQIEITQAEIDKAVRSIESQNKMPPNGITQILAKAGIPYATLEQQVKGQIALSKIKGKKIAPNITVSDEEITDYVHAQDLQPTQEEYFTNEIVLPVETSKDEVKVKELADKLAADLRSGKANFKKIAAQFSQSSSARNGGEVGWLGQNQVPKELLAEVKKYGTKVIIGPVKSVEGYFILYISDIRTINGNAAEDQVTIKQFEFGPGQAKSEADAINKARNINDVEAACTNAAAYAKAKNASTQSYDSVQINQLKPELQNTIITLPTKTFSKPILAASGVSTFVVCNRTPGNSPALDQMKHDKAKEAIYKRKMELESRKYLRDLRRDTNIELKV